MAQYPLETNARHGRTFNDNIDGKDVHMRIDTIQVTMGCYNYDRVCILYDHMTLIEYPYHVGIAVKKRQ